MANHSDNLNFEFELIGFPGATQRFFTLIGFTIFIIYIYMLLTNGTVVTLILLNKRLHEPMYILIANLSLSDLFFDTATLPKIMAKYWFNDGKISFAACLLQLHIVHCSTGIDLFILMLMSFDRYVAICRPLHYSLVVTQRVTMLGCGGVWFCIAILTLSNMKIIQQSFCGPNKVINLFCNSSAVLPLACDRYLSTQIDLLIVALVCLITTLTFIILSYIIILTVISLGKVESRGRAFYTCTTHLLVISLYYVPRIVVYVGDYTKLFRTPDLNVFLFLLYSYLPHLANPVIYCLRTEEIRKTIVGFFKRNRSFTM